MEPTDRPPQQTSGPPSSQGAEIVTSPDGLFTRHARTGRFARKGRDRLGRFKNGEPGPRLTTGKDSALVQSGELTGRVDELAAMRYGLQRGDLSIVRASLARRFTALDAIAQNLEDQIQTMGLVSAKGRKRSIGQAYFDAARLLLSYADRLGVPPAETREIPAEMTPEALLARVDAMAARLRELGKSATPATNNDRRTDAEVSIQEHDFSQSPTTRDGDAEAD